MSYTAKSTELINWVNLKIDCRKGGSEIPKIILAVKELILFSSILKSPNVIFPYEEYSYRIYWSARRLLEKIDPNLYNAYYQIVNQKENKLGSFKINGVDALVAINIFRSLTKAKAKSLKSALKKLNRNRPSSYNNRQMVENWCNALGLSIDLIDLDNADLDDLDRYLKTIARTCETVSISPLVPSPTV
jgi:hypothetical protein